MKKQELLELAAHLEEIPKEKWDFGHWCCRSSRDDNPISINACGTVGCAVGACTGLWPNVFQMEFDNGNRDGKVCLIGTNFSNSQAAAKFFEIEFEDASLLFTPKGYPNGRVYPDGQTVYLRTEDIAPQMVAAKIRKFVAESD